MKRILFFYFLLVGFSIMKARAKRISFVENKGQWNNQAKYRAEIPGAALYVTSNGFVYNCVQIQDLERIHNLTHKGQDGSFEKVNHHAYTVSFVGMNTNTVFTTDNKIGYYENYILGNDSKSWVANAHAYEKIKQHNIYDGIDIEVYNNKGNIKYDFIVGSLGNPKNIVLQYTGVTPEITKNGKLLIRTSVNEVTEEAPYAYQVIDGKETEVECHYQLENDKVSFALPNGYNPLYPLVIDPSLVFSTYSGAQSSSFYSFTTTYDLDGNLYSGGQAWGIGWPVSIGAFQINYNLNTDASIIKYDSSGANRLYATYYGGNGTDLPHAMVTNSQGELFIAGSTTSANLPVTNGCIDPTLSGSTDIFVAHFNSLGNSLLGATYIGGSSNILGGEPITTGFGTGSSGLAGQFTTSPCELILDSNQNIWVVSSSSSGDFPITPNAMQPTLSGPTDGVLFQLNPTCSQLLYSTFYGGNGQDALLNCQFNAAGSLVLCGSTTSTNLATTSNAIHPTSMGAMDGFVAVVDTTTHSLQYATYLGTTQSDLAAKLQVDLNNNKIYILGRTLGNYPISAGVYSMPNTDLFIDVLSSDLSTSIMSTRIGKTQGSMATFYPTAFLRDICGNVYIAGMNPIGSVNYSMPITPDAFQAGVSRFWFGVLNSNLSSLVFGTYLGNDTEDHTHVGAHRFDPKGVAYHSICSTNPSFPISAGTWSPVKQNIGMLDMISFKFNFNMMDVVADFELALGYNDTGCAPLAMDFLNLSTGANSYIWDFNDGNGSTQFEPIHTFQNSGLYNVTLIAYNDECLLSDTASKEIYVKPLVTPELIVNDTFLCDVADITISTNLANPTLGNIYFQWEPANAIISSPNQQSVVVNPALSGTFTVFVGGSTMAECIDTVTKTITISIFDYSSMFALPLDTNICPGDTVQLRAFGGTNYVWSPNSDIESITSSSTQTWPLDDITYQVMITNDSGCFVERAVNIHIYPEVKIDAGNDKVIKIGESTSLKGYSELPFVWTPAGMVNPSNSLTPIVSPSKTTTYYIRIISPEGCLVNDSVIVYVTNAMLPNAFSPNGDGLNDVFKLIPMDEHVSLEDFSVFNRYGQKVFFTRDIKEGWDGMYNGKPSDMNTYFYFIRYIIGERTYVLKGDVTLVR